MARGLIGSVISVSPRRKLMLEPISPKYAQDATDIRVLTGRNNKCNHLNNWILILFVR